MFWPRTVSFVNARVVAGDGEAGTVRFGARVLSVGEPPRRGDQVVDLQGAFVLPGLINAHDHLELNHYGRLKFRERYDNVSAWIDDMRPRLQTDPGLKGGRAHSLRDRVFAGAVKNVLAGVTTVAHHNPFYPELRRWLPIRVVRPYGWAHSFAMQREPAGARGEPGGDVGARYRNTPPVVPFFVHIAEGIDGPAQDELSRLEQAGCLRSNTVLIHGVGIRPDEWPRMLQGGAGLVWCPGSNLFLFGRTAQVRHFLRATPGERVPRIAIGTDSRLSGTDDLLEELRAAAGTAAASPRELLAMVTTGAAELLRQPGAGRIRRGAPADLIVIPPRDAEAGQSLLGIRRHDIELVVVDGRPVIGEPRMSAVFKARRVPTQSLLVDGRTKLSASMLARRIAASPIPEPGVDAA